MYVERSIKWGKWGKRSLAEKANITDLEERETNKQRQARLVNLSHRLHISVMALHIDWLGEEQMIEIDCRAAQRAKRGSISINITLFSSSYCFTV